MTQQNKPFPSPFTHNYDVLWSDNMMCIQALVSKDKTLEQVARDLKVDPPTLRRWYDNTMTNLDARNKFTTQLRGAIKVLKHAAQGTGAPSLALPVSGAPAPRVPGGSAPRAGRGLAPRAPGGLVPVASSSYVFEDTIRWLKSIRENMGGDLGLLTKTLHINEDTLKRWAQKKMTPAEQRKCTVHLRNRIKIVEDEWKMHGRPSMPMPFKGVAAAAGGPVAAAGGAAAAEPDHGTLVKALNKLLLAKVVELERRNEELRVVNDGWLRVTSAMMLHNISLQNTACPASASNE
jgi:hypothetical protein